MEYFHVAKFSRFCLKHEDTYLSFLVFEVFNPSEIIIATVPTFYIYIDDNSKPLSIVSNKIAVTVFKQILN